MTGAIYDAKADPKFFDQACADSVEIIKRLIQRNGYRLTFHVGFNHDGKLSASVLRDTLLAKLWIITVYHPTMPWVRVTPVSSWFADNGVKSAGAAFMKCFMRAMVTGLPNAHIKWDIRGK